MPETNLPRQKIIDEYYLSIHSTDDVIPELPQGLQETASNPTFGASFHTEAPFAIDPTEQVENTTSALKPKITPMLHQRVTSENIIENFKRGITTVVLGDPLGAGKTYEAIYTYLNLRKLNPNLGIVITIPDMIMPDWLQAFNNVNIKKSDCQFIMAPADALSVDLSKLASILFVKKNLSLSTHLAHQVALAKLQAIYSLPRFHIFDEKTSANPTLITLYECAKHNPRLILSGTVVTNSIQDINEQFHDAKQIGSSIMRGIMAENSEYFCRYFTTTFYGINPTTPGKIFLNFLSLSTYMHTAFHSRLPSSLPIKLPEFSEEFLCIDPPSTLTQSATIVGRNQPIMLLSNNGVTVKADMDFNKYFLETHSSRWYHSKLMRLIAELHTHSSDAPLNDILVITASQTTSSNLVNDLELEARRTKYCCILISDPKREQKTQAAHNIGLSVIFITEHRRVEGFNIQKHLAKIICFDAVRDAGDYAQAVGRAVRSGNQSSSVQIKQYCTRHTVNYIEERIRTTRKAKTLLELIHADPAAIYLLLTKDVLTRQNTKLRKGVDFDRVLTSVRGALACFCNNLQQICSETNPHQVVTDLVGLLTNADHSNFNLFKWRTDLQMNPFKLREPFEFLFLFEEDMSKFAFDAPSGEQFSIIQMAMTICKVHLRNSLASSDLTTLLQPHYLELAHGFNLMNEYLQAIQRNLMLDAPLSPPESFTTLQIIYSLTPRIFSEQPTIQFLLLKKLKENDFFGSISFEMLTKHPIVLFAYVDANFDQEKSYQQLSILFVDALKTNQQQMYAILSQFKAYNSFATHTLLNRILQRLYRELEFMAEQAPRTEYSAKHNYFLAQHLGKLNLWMQRTLNFVKTLAPADPYRSMILTTYQASLKHLSQPERNALYRIYSDLLNAKYTLARSVSERFATEPLGPVTLDDIGVITKRTLTDSRLSHSDRHIQAEGTHPTSIMKPPTPSSGSVRFFASALQTTAAPNGVKLTDSGKLPDDILALLNDPVANLPGDHDDSSINAHTFNDLGWF